MTARQLQNKLFGLGRNMKGVNNDLKTRHKSRAMDKLDTIANELYEIETATDELYKTIGESFNGSN